MNVLFLGGARRVSMARMFKAAGAATLYSYEMDMHVPILAEAEVVIGLRWSAPAIYTHLHELCTSRDIRVVVPFVDGAVAVAANLASRYPGEIFVPTADACIAEAMFDKVRAAELFAEASLPIPRTYKPGDSAVGLIAKPRRGSASKGIICIDSEAELAPVLAAHGEYLIQERIDRRREYTVDCYVSVHTGSILAVSPRMRIEIVGGEVTHTMTVDRPDISALAVEALECMGLRGAVTVQVLEDTDTGRLMLMEINPRLGGGAVCSVHAGVDLPAMILAEAGGTVPRPVQPRAGVEILRYYDEVVIDSLPTPHP